MNSFRHFAGVFKAGNCEIEKWRNPKICLLLYGRGFRYCPNCLEIERFILQEVTWKKRAIYHRANLTQNMTEQTKNALRKGHSTCMRATYFNLFSLVVGCLNKTEMGEGTETSLPTWRFMASARRYQQRKQHSLLRKFWSPWRYQEGIS